MKKQGTDLGVEAAKMLQLAKPFRYMALALFCLGAFMIVVLFSIIPMWRQHGQIEKEVKSYEKKLEMLESFAKSHKSFEEEYALKKRKLARLKEAYAFGLQSEEYIVKLQQLADEKELLLTISRLPDKPGKKKDLENICYEVKLSGEYGAILKFMDSVEQMKVLSLENIKIEAANTRLINIIGILRIYNFLNK